MKILIKITQEDIDSGEPKIPGNCPVARGMKRVLGHPVAVFYTTYLDHKICERKYLPTIVAAWIQRFECGEFVEPFEFELEAY